MAKLPRCEMGRYSFSELDLIVRADYFGMFGVEKKIFLIIRGVPFNFNIRRVFFKNDKDEFFSSAGGGRRGRLLRTSFPRLIFNLSRRVRRIERLCRGETGAQTRLAY